MSLKLEFTGDDGECLRRAGMDGPLAAFASRLLTAKRYKA